MGRLSNIRARTEAGVATAEYAVATVAACGFGTVLITVLESPAVRGFLFNAIRTAFRAIT